VEEDDWVLEDWIRASLLLLPTEKALANSPRAMRAIPAEHCRTAIHRRVDLDSFSALHNHEPMTSKGASIDVGAWLRDLGFGEYEARYPDEALHIAQDQLARARQLGHIFNLIWSLFGGGITTIANAVKASRLSRTAAAAYGCDGVPPDLYSV
jgi:hypothetical protein